MCHTVQHVKIPIYGTKECTDCFGRFEGDEAIWNLIPNVQEKYIQMTADRYNLDEISNKKGK